MSWKISIPFHKGATPLQAAGDAGVLAQQQDRDVARALMLIAGERGLSSVEDFARAYDGAHAPSDLNSPTWHAQMRLESPRIRRC